MTCRWGLISTGILLCTASWTVVAAEVDPLVIKLLSYDHEKRQVVLHAEGPVTAKGFSLQNPDRWVVDIPNSVYRGLQRRLISVPGTGIRQVRIAQFTPSMVRIVFDLDTMVQIPHWIETAKIDNRPDFRLVFDISKINRAPSAEQASISPSRTLARSADEPLANWLGWFKGSNASADFHHDEDRGHFELEPTPLPVSGLTLRRAGKGWIMRITAERPIEYRLQRFGRRDRLYLHLIGGDVALPRESVYVDNGLIVRVRKGEIKDGLTPVIIEFDKPLRYEAHLASDGQSVVLGLSHPKPRQIPVFYDDRITIDAGHGGSDPGAISMRGIQEKDITLQLATRLQEMLQSSGMDVQLTRARDSDLLLSTRVEMNDEFKSQVFVSIHTNSAPTSAVQGIETYYFTPQSLHLARSVHRRLVTLLGRPDRGIRKNNFVVVKYTQIPACLVELGYLSNPQEETLLASEEYQRRAAA
ncbi:MAG: N-acetylmuramoyl-L-alanine amidase, partial [Cyanobacteria bacterium NC_groundwater_1444_Ag_S-0.65um_54_12]|nr:N-acetylmuramoyl-L-alanine amidase [Cyanobacteria bacterium NC_groundwater_1444_Ag_S-0.65um_54_12]